MIGSALTTQMRFLDFQLLLGTWLVKQVRIRTREGGTTVQRRRRASREATAGVAAATD